MLASASESERYGRMLLNLKRAARCMAPWVLVLSLVLAGVVLGQDSNRKVIARTAPTYPELARRMHLSGKVKLELVVLPAGAVKSAKLVGGNPVFERNAVEAAKQWRFEAAAKETKETILLEFVEQ
jgi:TonB family protein